MRIAALRYPPDEELPVPEDWSILVEKAQAVPSPQPLPQSRSRHQAEQ